MKLSPGDHKLHVNRGSCYARMSEYDRAIDDFTTAIQLEPGDPMTYLNRGYTYIDKGDYDKGLADLRTAVDLDSSLTPLLERIEESLREKEVPSPGDFNIGLLYAPKDL